MRRLAAAVAAALAVNLAALAAALWGAPDPPPVEAVPLTATGTTSEGEP